ncbi:type VI secretion system lipoprotein TssJ [Aliikangiella marina]|uniref:Type VI secretion system lipoprotein TssJ n=1 Tax=Aliikangiella marina TaxID=1712262 RepID=A0A545TGU5_9GAMM|nr:type VI secretion system lipoprotein TssJ [Aliikangiella marina]TQV76416.1 type VI secretion system lipoprotein TssJ [Aliikangiella marina]
MITLNNKIVSLVVILSVSIMLSGCQTVGKTLNLDTDVLLTFDVQADVNPDDTKTPSPLFVRFYELKSNSVFEKAEFIDLYERDKEVLGPDLIAKQELKRLTPGEKREQTFVLNPETQYIGLFAEFYDYADSKYRLVVPVKVNNIFEDEVLISISGNTISLKE